MVIRLVRWSRTCSNLLLLGLGLSELFVIAWLPYFVTEDGPIHLSGAATLATFGYPGHSIYSQYYSLSFFPVPNLSTELMLTALVHVVSPYLAEKLLIGGYILALPFALRYAVRSVRPGSDWLAFLAFPFTFTFTFHYGFYNFSYGVVLFLVTVGYGIRHRCAMSVWNIAILGLLLLVSYATHIVAFCEAMLFLGPIATWDWVVTLRKAPYMRQGRYAWHQLGARLYPLVLAAAPSLVFTAAFVLHTGSANAATSFGWHTPWWKLLVGLLSLTWGLLSYDSRETAACLLLALIVLVLVVVAVRARLAEKQLRSSDALALVALISSGAYLLVPEQIASGGGFITERLALFPFYAVVLWLADQQLGGGLRMLTASGAVVVAIGLLVIRMPIYTHFSRQTAEYMSVATCIRSNSTLVQLNLWQDLGPGGLRRPGSLIPLDNEASRIAAERSGIDLDNGEAGVPFYLYHFRDTVDPFLHLELTHPGMDTVPPQVDLRAYNQSTPGKVDYVLVLGRTHTTPQVLQSVATHRLERDLAAAYQLIAVSRPSRLLEVYALRGMASTACRS